jgi:DNA-binding SARP family transcriptional activator
VDEVLVLCEDHPLRIDLDEFETAADAARRLGTPDAYRAALDLYTGELLPEDRDEQWAAPRRSATRERHAALLVELAGLHAGPGTSGPRSRPPNG